MGAEKNSLRGGFRESKAVLSGKVIGQRGARGQDGPGVKPQGSLFWKEEKGWLCISNGCLGSKSFYVSSTLTRREKSASAGRNSQLFFQ